MSEFNYNKMWELEEPVKMPHAKRSEELGIQVSGVTVSPALTKYSESIRRIEESFNMPDLEEAGIAVNQLLSSHTEMQVIDFLEEQGFEHSLSLGEIEGLLFGAEWRSILQIPRIKGDFFLLKQFEESSNGRLVDVSAFGTVDFLKTLDYFEFDKYKYLTDKVAEKAEEMAIMHSCISDATGKERVKQRFISFVNQKYRDYALRLVAMMRSTDDEGKKADLMRKIQERNRQIRRLKLIWKKYAYWDRLKWLTALSFHRIW